MTLNLAKVESPMTKLIELYAPILVSCIFKLVKMIPDLLLTCRFQLV